MYDWDKITKAMRNGVVVVTFTKADGTSRDMQCTLADYLLPETSGANADRPKNPDIIVCFDIEKEAWRSFRKYTVTNVEIL